MTARGRNRKSKIFNETMKGSRVTMDTDNVSPKTCTKCGEEKPASSEFFYKSRCTKDKLFPHCKECHKKYCTQRAREKNPNPDKTNRLPWNKDDDEKLIFMIQDYEKTGIIPKGCYPCRRCGRLKPNVKEAFPLQPGFFKNEDGSRKFSTVCRKCQNTARRRASARHRGVNVSGGYTLDGYGNQNPLNEEQSSQDPSVTGQDQLFDENRQVAAAPKRKRRRNRYQEPDYSQQPVTEGGQILW